MEIGYEDVRKWIVEHSDDKSAMDELNKLTYVFTSKYAERELQQRQ